MRSVPGSRITAAVIRACSQQDDSVAVWHSFQLLAAYPLSVKDFVGRKVFASLFVFVMIFTVPLIPTYPNVKNLNFLDSMWALIVLYPFVQKHFVKGVMVGSVKG